MDRPLQAKPREDVMGELGMLQARMSSAASEFEQLAGEYREFIRQYGTSIEADTLTDFDDDSEVNELVCWFLMAVDALKTKRENNIPVA